MNSDGSLPNNGAGIGVVLRKSYRLWLTPFSRARPRADILVIELLAVRRGLELGQEKRNERRHKERTGAGRRVGILLYEQVYWLALVAGAEASTLHTV